ncbi:hypothetical protein DVH24_019974 [Malus domestica]|uniref:Late embryogenesis abundant protein LEA-2 subgroup domain-containing protein n=1 Tax=Malus domestica TaxID=3750 RepID=A0A498I0E3_MALDO|nr:hypothetical protein DVH24_019974 [Malus domestica]
MANQNNFFGAFPLLQQCIRLGDSFHQKKLRWLRRPNRFIHQPQQPMIIVITVISLTVMKVKTLKVRLSNINVQELTSVPVTPSFDTKFTTQIRVKSTNWGPYKFDASTVSFLYRGAAVRQVVIPKSKAGMLSTKKINVAVTLNSNKLNAKI